MDERDFQAEHWEAKDYRRYEALERHVEEIKQTVATVTATARAQLDIIQALEHRLVVLESRMENVLARLDGHDLGFATLSVDEAGKATFARMMRLGEQDRPIVPGEKGTSES